MYGTCFEIEARRRVNLACQSIEPRGLEPSVGRQVNLVERLHEVAENRALRTARRLHLFLKFFLVVRLPLGAHDDGFNILVVVDAGDLIIGTQHVLIEKIAHGQQIWMIADGHQRHDFTGVEIKRQRTLGNDSRLSWVALVINSLNVNR